MKEKKEVCFERDTRSAMLWVLAILVGIPCGVWLIGSFFDILSILMDWLTNFISSIYYLFLMMFHEISVLCNTPLSNLSISGIFKLFFYSAFSFFVLLTVWCLGKSLLSKFFNEEKDDEMSLE